MWIWCEIKLVALIRFTDGKKSRWIESIDLGWNKPIEQHPRMQSVRKKKHPLEDHPTYPLENKHGTQKLVICRCFSFSRGPFSGSMFVFRGVLVVSGWGCYFQQEDQPLSNTLENKQLKLTVMILQVEQTFTRRFVTILCPSVGGHDSNLWVQDHINSPSQLV